MKSRTKKERKLDTMNDRKGENKIEGDRVLERAIYVLHMCRLPFGGAACVCVVFRKKDFISSATILNALHKFIKRTISHHFTHNHS